MNASAIRSRPGLLAPGRWVTMALILCLAGPAGAQQTFPTPEAAVATFGAALKSNDEAALVRLVGEKYRHLVVTGDRVYDAALRERLTQGMATFSALSERGADRRVLLVGAQAWPLAIPLVREGGSWHFSGEQGEEELLNRRIGANERYAIYVSRAYVDAQRQYAAIDRDGDGVRQYAAKLASSPGKQDGLYWPADEARGEEPSPLGPLVAASSGSVEARKAGEPYRGYHYRMLSAQGRSAAGGAYGYLINGRMIAGFALVAWPHEYGRTGVMTFIVNHNGKVFEKDLGPQTESIAARIRSFDPGPGWREVEP